ncbi:MAG TPA: TldD/PmbA family protein [Thermoplasmata archaeon]|nr:TldD/PmbA family protein [Thermoplasmata archaeon]
MDLLELAPDATKRALAQGAEQAEAFAIRYATRHVYIEDDVPKVAEDRHEVGLGIRVARGRRVAFASTTLASPTDAASAVRSAVAGLRQIPEDPKFVGFAHGDGKGSVAGVFDAATADTDVETFLTSARAFVDAAKETKSVSVPKATFRLQEYALRITNSNGVDAAHRGTLVYAYLTTKAGSGSSVGEGIVHGVRPRLKDVDFSDLGKVCARRAVENREAKAFPGKLSGTTIIDPQELGQLFLQAVGAAVCGQNVYRKRSPWADKVGAEVGTPQVTIRDRPRLRGGMLSCASDDEGAPTQDRTVVGAGRLTGLLADTYHAPLVSAKPGNAFRRGAATLEGAYLRPPENAVSNLVLEPGTESLDDLLGKVDHGVYVEKFAAPELNPITGAFACEVRNATLVERGGLGNHVKFALLTGNFYDGLKEVEGIGRDLEPIPVFYGAPGCAYVPSVAFGGFELVGQS